MFAEAREALGADRRLRCGRRRLAQEDVPVWELPLERWEETLRANLTAPSSRRAASCGSGADRPRQPRPRRLDRRPRSARLATPTTRRRSPRSWVGCSWSEERDRPRRAARARERCAPGLDRFADDARPRRPGRSSARVTRTMPLRKVARPEDVARQVVVLASDELSGHVTGQIVTVAGGMEGRLLHPLAEACKPGGGPAISAAGQLLRKHRRQPAKGDRSSDRPATVVGPYRARPRCGGGGSRTAKRPRCGAG